MKKAILLLLTIFGLHLSAEPLPHDGPVLQEMTLEVALEDLSINSEEISVIYQGQSLPVQMLQRRGNSWIALVSFGRNAGYCQRGHDLCTNCGCCHKKGCWYYVPQCKG